jgi:hypothetical protein
MVLNLAKCCVSIIIILPDKQRRLLIPCSQAYHGATGSRLAGRLHEQGAQSCDETIACPEIRRPLPGAIQDQELLLDENRLGGHTTDAART